METAPNEPASAAAPAHLAFIDALRGIAAFYVLVFHIILIPSPRLAYPAWAGPVLMNGGTGVTLFFVVSAFTLCHTLRARQGTPGATLKFYVRRAARIVPLYYAWLAAMVLVVNDWTAAGLWRGKWHLVPFLTFTYNPVPRWQEGIVWASWTLGVEMVFYVAFPAIFAVVRTTRRAVAFVAVALLLATAHDAAIRAVLPASAGRESFIHCGILHQLPVFALGMLAYFIYYRVRDLRRGRVPAGTVLLTAGGVAFGLLPTVGLQPAALLYLMAVTYAVLLLGLSLVPVRLVVNRVTAFAGAISYSVYLNHPQLVLHLQPAYHRIYATDVGPAVQLLGCVAVTAVPLVAVSYLTYRLIEQPGIRLGGRLIRWLEQAGRTRAERIVAGELAR